MKHAASSSNKGSSPLNKGSHPSSVRIQSPSCGQGRALSEGTSRLPLRLEREGGRGGEAERERSLSLYIYIYIYYRGRGTTLESHDCPVWCAALTSSRLPNQAPAAPHPFDPGGWGRRPPPPGEGNEKVRDVTQGGKKIFTIAVQIPAREGVRPVSRGAVPCGTALQAAAGNPSSTVPPKISATGAWTAGARTLGLAGKSPRGGVRRAAWHRGDTAEPRPWPHAPTRVWAGRAGGCCASSLSDGELHS